MGAPQILWIVMNVLGLLSSAILDGEPKTGIYSFAITFCGTCSQLALLWWGGFFG